MIKKGINETEVHAAVQTSLCLRWLINADARVYARALFELISLLQLCSFSNIFLDFHTELTSPVFTNDNNRIKSYFSTAGKTLTISMPGNRR